MLSENEWTRIIFESGPILGLAFLMWRTLLAVYLGVVSLRALTRGEILPLLLFSATFLIILSGQLGQPTSLGFAVVFNGLCLASHTARQNCASAGHADDATIDSRPIGLR